MVTRVRPKRLSDSASKPAASTEMVTRLDDFMRRRSKIDLVVSEADVRSSAGLHEVASILFGADADRRLHEYYRHRGWES